MRGRVSVFQIVLWAFVLWAFVRRYSWRDACSPRRPAARRYSSNAPGRRTKQLFDSKPTALH